MTDKIEKLKTEYEKICYKIDNLNSRAFDLEQEIKKLEKEGEE